MATDNSIQGDKKRKKTDAEMAEALRDHYIQNNIDEYVSRGYGHGAAMEQVARNLAGSGRWTLEEARARAKKVGEGNLALGDVAKGQAPAPLGASGTLVDDGWSTPPGAPGAPPLMGPVRAKPGAVGDLSPFVSGTEGPASTGLLTAATPAEGEMGTPAPYRAGYPYGQGANRIPPFAAPRPPTAPANAGMESQTQVGSPPAGQGGGQGGKGHVAPALKQGLLSQALKVASQRLSELGVDSQTGMMGGRGFQGGVGQ